MNPFRFKLNPLICAGGDDPISSSTIRYAPYIEAKHTDFLNTVADSRKYLLGDSGDPPLSISEWSLQGVTSIAERAVIAIELANLSLYPERDVAYQVYLDSFPASAPKASPYARHINIAIDSAFFGANYTISDFPSMYDMYGKFVAGLDIDALFDQEFESTVNSPEVNALMAAESDLMQDEIEMNILPTYELGARDINSVMSSVYAIEGANVMGDAKIKALAKYEAQLRYNLIPLATQRWQTHLTWNQNVIAKYADIMKLYYAAKMDVDNFNTNMGAKDSLWPFTVLEYERAALGALTGAKNTTSTQSDGDSGLGGILGVVSTVLGMF